MSELTEYKHAHDYWEAEAKRLCAELAAQKEATDAFWEQRDEWQERAEKAEAELAEAKAELDISREAHRMVQSALLSQAAETERAEAKRNAAIPAGGARGI